MCGLENESLKLNLDTSPDTPYHSPPPPPRISTRDKRSLQIKQSERDAVYVQKLQEVDESSLMLFIDDIEGKEKGVRVSKP